MSIHTDATERVEQTKRSLRHYIKSDHIEYMAYMGAVIECELLIQQYNSEQNKTMVLHHSKMKNIIVRRFEKYCLKAGPKYKSK